VVALFGSIKIRKNMIKKLNDLYELGLLQKQTHPTFPLIIWNYTPKVQFEKLWNTNELLIKCRGLVTDFNGNIICYCIPKFFNIEELKPEEIPNEPFEIFEKMDGSYITMFIYNDEWIFASRGSFTSDQAILAKKLFNNKYKNKISLNKNYNYIMELIGKDNKIVVDYPENDLILLICFSVNEGNEISIYSDEFKNFNRVKKYSNIDDIKTLKSIISDDAEGFVVKFKSGMRMKIKGVNYLRLHKIITNVSNLVIWEHLKNGGNFNEFINDVPDEFFSWVNKTIKNLRKEFNEIECQALTNFAEIHSSDRKSFAIEAMKFKKYTSILFRMYDKRLYDDIIWKMIKPKFSKPFKDGFDDDL
jgi:RNA ligase